MKHELTFEWVGGSTCAADHMKETFKKRGIQWKYNKYFQLTAALNGRDFVPIEYYHIDGQTFGIIERPVTTDNYFDMTWAELSKKYSNGYTREECIILDHTLINCPFHTTLCGAVEEAEYQREQGYYDDIRIVRMIHGNGYAVLAR